MTTSQPKRKIVTTETSSMTKKGFKTFPKLRMDDITVITFIGQIKDIDSSLTDIQNDPYMEEIEYYYDDTSRSYFKIGENVSAEIKARVKAKSGVKLQKKTLAVALEYEMDPKTKQIKNVKDCFILSLGADKMKAFKEIKDNERLDNPSWSLYDVDYTIKCTDEQFQKWLITPRKAKAFSTIEDQAMKKEILDEALRMIDEDFLSINGKVLDDAALIEKFCLDIDSEEEVNPMASGSEGEEFSSIKKSTGNSPFAKRS